MDFEHRYYFDSSGSTVQLNYKVELLQPIFDDVVDRSSFRPNAENVRQSVLSGSGFVEKGVFDDPNNLPSDIQVLVRSGKLDKAEIDDYIRSEADRLNGTLDKQLKDKELSDIVSKIKESTEQRTEQTVGVNQN